MSSVKKIVFVSVLVAALSSCASTEVANTWSNPYVDSTSVEEIIELRGQPFDAVTDDNGDTTLTFYGGGVKGNGWVWVPYVNMVAAGNTYWVTKEQVTVSSKGGYKAASGETRKLFQQMFVGAVQELDALSDDFPDEMRRSRAYMERRGLSFDERQWEANKGYRRKWDAMQ